MKALLFDMDGVLVDVSLSYREAIRATVRHFSESHIGDDEIQGYKDRGGLNNDWDLTLAALEERGVSAGRGEVVEVFQSLYRGNDFDGLIRNESWLLEQAILENLARGFRLGIVTGRPAAETLFTLRRFGVAGFFPAVVTMDDIPPGRGKPDPLGVRMAVSKLGVQADGYYAGDSIDDMKAALGAGLIPLGIVPAGAGSGQRSALLARGAWRVLDDINRIEEVLR